VVEVVLFLGTVQHEVLAAALQITKGCLFHNDKKQGGLVSRLAKPFLALD
jgi:hypothetical protein